MGTYKYYRLTRHVKSSKAFLSSMLTFMITTQNLITRFLIKIIKLIPFNSCSCCRIFFKYLFAISCQEHNFSPLYNCV